jgi:GMP synthase (glutamine-hydrolysing)
MVRILVVDNGGQWTHREWRMLREIGCDTNIISNTASVDGLDADGLVLSGGALTVDLASEKLGNCVSIIKRFSGPILGICAGHQILALVHNGKVGSSLISEYGLTKVKVVECDDLFRGVPQEFVVWESHNDEVKCAPECRLLAESMNCKVQAVKYIGKAHYGVQFHPEVNNTEFGELIFRNFVGICASQET